MKESINVDGQIEEPDGEHQEKFLIASSQVQKGPDEVIAYLRSRDQLIADLVPYFKGDLQVIKKLPLVEKNKILMKLLERIIIPAESQLGKDLKN